MNLSRRRFGMVAVLLGVALAVGASFTSTTAQTPSKRTLSYDVYDSWRTIAGTRLSDDGVWLAYALTAPGDDGALVVRNLKTDQEFRASRGTAPQFTADGAHVLFTIVPPKSETGENAARGGGAAGPPVAAGGGTGGRGGPGGGAASARNSLGIMTLTDGRVTTIDRVADYKLPAESSTWVAYHRAAADAGRGRGAGRGQAATPAPGGTPTLTPATTPMAVGAEAAAAEATPAQTGTTAPAAPEKQKTSGTDLIVRNLVTATETTLAEVTEYVWTKDGGSLAYVVSSADATKDGVFVRATSDAAVRALQTGKGNYRGLSLDDAGKQVAFISDFAEYEKPVSPYRLYYWKVGEASAIELVSGTTRGMPGGMVVSEHFAPVFSEDASRVFLGTAPPPAPPAEPNAKAPVRVDLWSTRDALIQPVQQVRATEERNRNYRAVVHLSDKRFVQLAAKDLPTINPGLDPDRVIGLSDIPYQQEQSWDANYTDVYLVDLKTAARRKVLEHMRGSASMSPGGNYLLYFDPPQGHWFTYRVSDGTRTNLTQRLPVKFVDETHDTPNLAPSLGSAGWTDGDKSVLLYDQFDIWEIRPDGTNPRMLTRGEGRKQQLVFRYRTLDSEERVIPMNKPMLLSTTHHETRASGYYRLPNPDGTAAPEKLMMIDKTVGAPIKAKKADVVVFTEQTFVEFPDLWASDSTFMAPRKVTDANPQQAEFNWGRAERVSYINADGKTLGAILIKPENFDRAKTYPLMVYIYEDLSEGLHSYRAPNVATSINLSRYVSNGYVVLLPDISYETGYPGPSAMKCVIPAVHSIVAQGYIDPKRIGIQGHSWGGYQITYMITQTNMFRAAEAGASVANMISAYGGIRWQTGLVRQFQYEKTQSRIGAAPWDAPLQYIENSPIFWVERVNTPYLTIHNDADGAVPWYQGIEFNQALRRLGKEAYMFTFNGEGHGLTNRDNQKYWTVHMDEFFDHYLLGKPRPEWMDKGVSFLERGTRDVTPLFKKQPVGAPLSSADARR